MLGGKMSTSQELVKCLIDPIPIGSTNDPRVCVFFVFVYFPTLQIWSNKWLKLAETFDL